MNGKMMARMRAKGGSKENTVQRAMIRSRDWDRPMELPVNTASRGVARHGRAGSMARTS